MLNSVDLYRSHNDRAQYPIVFSYDVEIEIHLISDSPSNIKYPT